MQLDADLAPVQKQKAAAAPDFKMAAFMTKRLEFRVDSKHFFKIGTPFTRENGQQIFQAERFFLPPLQEGTINDRPGNGGGDSDFDHP